MNGIYLVAGATSGVGQQIVSKLLLRNALVRVLARDVNKARALLGENLEIIQGDAHRIDTVHEAVQGVQAVLCALSADLIDGHDADERAGEEGVQNLARAAASAEVERFVLVSSLGLTRIAEPPSEGEGALAEMQKGEEALRACGLVYTIVRPGTLTDEPGGQTAFRVGQGDRLSGQISRADVATVALEALEHDQTHNTTFEVVAGSGPPPSSPEDWSSLFADLTSDLQTGAPG